MKKILFLILALILAGPIYLIASGTIGTSSVAMALNTITGRGVETPTATQRNQRFKLPAGFSLNLYAGDLPRSRFLQFTPRGDLLVSRPHSGDIILLRRNPDTPDVAGERVTLLEGLTRPSGLALSGDWLYIGESNAIGRVRLDYESGATTSEYQHLITGLTDDGNHPAKIIGIGPDQKLYLSQGSTCNVCVEEDNRRSTLSRFNLDGTGEEVLATGLRNTMGMAWAPWDNSLYATDNGRDLLGDDYPPCELNLITEGGFYGWPYYNGANEPDPDYGQSIPAPASKPIPPVLDFRAHNAPLGIGFFNTNGWPEGFDKVALVALHGSWNRSTPDGYRVVSLHWEGDSIEQRDFLTGFELDGDIIGRPVDVAQGPDGAIYISDDYAGAIYRVTYGPSSASSGNLGTISEKPFQLSTPDWLNADNRDILAARGESLYQDHDCDTCHNPEIATGRTALTNIHERMQFEELIDRLTNPNAPMPALPLSVEEKRALAVYLLLE